MVDEVRVLISVERMSSKRTLFDLTRTAFEVLNTVVVL